MPREGDGHAISAGESHGDAGLPTRAEFARLQRSFAELDGRVRANQRDIDVQFHRIAEMQAVIDRIQIAAVKTRAKREHGR